MTHKMIQMKCQVLFSLKTRKNVTNLLSSNVRHSKTKMSLSTKFLECGMVLL